MTRCGTDLPPLLTYHHYRFSFRFVVKVVLPTPVLISGTSLVALLLRMNRTPRLQVSGYPLSEIRHIESIPFPFYINLK